MKRKLSRQSFLICTKSCLGLNLVSNYHFARNWARDSNKCPLFDISHLNLRLWCLSCSSYVARSLTALEMHSTGHTIFSVGSRVTLVGWVKDQATESWNYKEPHDVFLFMIFTIAKSYCSKKSKNCHFPGSVVSNEFGLPLMASYPCRIWPKLKKCSSQGAVLGAPKLMPKRAKSIANTIILACQTWPLMVEA